MGYCIGKFTNGKFVNLSGLEEINEDLYDHLYGQMDYPLNYGNETGDQDEQARHNQFINFMEKDSNWHQWPRRLRGRTGSPDVCSIEIKGTKTEPTIEELIESATEGITDQELKKAFNECLHKHKAIYSRAMTDCGLVPNELFHIRIKKGSQPAAYAPYPHSFKQSTIIGCQIGELLKAKFIRVSDSPWAAPVLLVPKPTRNGKEEWRMCVDYRGLNIRTIRDKYPIPSMKDLYSKLRGNSVFSSIDIRSGYWNVEIAPEDRHKTASSLRRDCTNGTEWHSDFAMPHQRSNVSWTRYLAI